MNVNKIKLRDAGLQSKLVRTSGAETQGCACNEKCAKICLGACDGEVDIICEFMGWATPGLGAGFLSS